MSKAWMPLYVGDYLGDTTHLTQGQHGAYFLLIMHYWQRGSLPISKEQCYCIAHALDKQGRCNADTILGQFFVLNEHGYRHSRIDVELLKARESYNRRAGAARSRWDKKKLSDTALDIQSMSNPSDCDSDSDLEPKVLEVAKLYPKIADPSHLSHEHQTVIVEAVVRHGDEVLKGTQRFRKQYDRWKTSDQPFAPSVANFFRQSEYMHDAKTWEREGMRAASTPNTYIPESVRLTAEREARKKAAAQ